MNEDWKARDRDEAAAIVDFIDAVDAYNLRDDHE